MAFKASDGLARDEIEKLLDGKHAERVLLDQLERIVVQLSFQGTYPDILEKIEERRTATRQSISVLMNLYATSGADEGVSFNERGLQQLNYVMSQRLHQAAKERHYFTRKELELMFHVHYNTIDNWLKGKGTPEGFKEAYENGDIEAMRECAERRLLNKNCPDPSGKGAVHNLTEEEMYHMRLRNARG